MTRRSSDKLQLADLKSYLNAKIEKILIGADYIPLIYSGELVKSKSDNLIAHSSLFGQIVSRILPEQANKSHDISVHLITISDKSIQIFLEIKEVPTVKLMSPDDEKCKAYFSANVNRESNGRFSVILLNFNWVKKNKVLVTRNVGFMSIKRMEWKSIERREWKFIRCFTQHITKHG